jgi:hypothetical protein
MNYSSPIVIVIIGFLLYLLFNYIRQRRLTKDTALDSLPQIASKHGWTLNPQGQKLIDQAMHQDFPMLSMWSRNWFLRTKDGNKTYVVASKKLGSVEWFLAWHRVSNGDQYGGQSFFAIEFIGKQLPEFEGHIVTARPAAGYTSLDVAVRAMPQASVQSVKPKKYEGSALAEKYFSINKKMVILDQLIREKDYIQLTYQISFSEHMERQLEESFEEFDTIALEMNE